MVEVFPKVILSTRESYDFEGGLLRLSDCGDEWYTDKVLAPTDSCCLSYSVTVILGSVTVFTSY